MTKLKVELIPSSSFFSNVRSHTTQTQWDKLRRECYQNAGYMCEICYGRGPKHPVECHEVWKYNPTKKIQRLERLIALCPACHEVKHIGLAGKNGRFKQALKHLMKINKWTEERALTHVEKAKEKWKERNKISWTLDLSAIGIVIKGKITKRKHKATVEWDTLGDQLDSTIGEKYGIFDNEYEDEYDDDPHWDDC